MHQDPSICISAPEGTRVLYFHFLHAFLSYLYIYLRRRDETAGCRRAPRPPARGARTGRAGVLGGGKRKHGLVPLFSPAKRSRIFLRISLAAH